MEPIVVTVSLFLMIFAILYVYFTTRNKERMALIEKGVDASLFQGQPRSLRISGYATFKWGLFLIGLALGLFVGVLFDQYTSLPEPPMYISMIFVFGGLSLVLAYMLKGRLDKRERS
jgi:ABC-type Fe3+ transport system permease subunit